MNKHNILSITVVVFALLLLALVFFYLIPTEVLPMNFRVLDFLALSIMWIIWSTQFFRPLIKMSDESQQQVGGLGLRWIAMGTYTTFSLLAVIYSICMGYSGDLAPEQFKYYLILQLFILFLFMLGMAWAFAAEKKTKEVYEDEKMIKASKKEVKQALSELLYVAEDTAGIPADIRRRLQVLSGETRFITPSKSQAAVSADNSILNDCDILGPAFADYEMNKTMIERYMLQLERDIARRRKEF